MTTAATLDPPQLALPPGGEATCVLTVRNHTDIVEGYQFSVVGDVATWATVEPPSLRLYPGSEAQVRVIFRMPPAARVEVRDIPFGVRVIPMERPDNATVPEGILRVGAIIEVGGDLLPETSKSRRSALHDVAIDNTGNTPLQVVLQATDPEEALSFRARPASMVVPPGQAAIAQLRVQHRKLRWRGKPTPRKFRVALTSPGSAPVLLHGTAVQRPVFGAWLWKAAAALIALLLLAAGLWAGLVKPAVKSAADKAAQDAVAVSESQRAAEEKAGGGGGGGAQPSTSPSAAAPAAPPSASSNGGTPYSKTLALDAGAGKTKGIDVPRPAKTRLHLTFYQFQAAQGDSALLRILVGDQPMFPYQLYNYRLFDVHPSPIVEVPADKQLRIELACTTPGTDPAGKAATACRVDIQFVGTTFAA